MKNILTALLGVFLLASCNQNPKDFACITGTYKGKSDGKEIQLFKVEHGTTTKVASSAIGNDGKFGFIHSVETPGLYVVNVVWSESQRKDRKDHNLKRFYLENGTNIDIDLKDGSYILNQTNNNKNKLLSQWNNQVDTLFTYSHGFMYQSTTYKDFFPFLPGQVEKKDEFKTKINSGDAKFDELMKLMLETDMATSAFTFLHTPRMFHPKKEDYPDYYNTVLEHAKPKSERLLELPHGLAFMRLYATFCVGQLPRKLHRNEYLKVSLFQISNDLLRGYYALDLAKRFKTYDNNYLSFREFADTYLKNDYLKEEFKKFELSIRTFEKGSPAVDFSGTDVNGKTHKLSDYKGNLVYVDVWATWCGPCKGQIPALKELEKKLHGKAITFLSISLDEQKNRQKWVDFVKKEQLGGVQIIADKAFDSEVAKAYGINGIPRFMLFDKEGKVVTIDAPRPSEKKTEAWLKSMLK